MIANPYSKPYYTNTSRRQLHRDKMNNTFDYNNKPGNSNARGNTYLHCFSSDSDESVYKDDLPEFNNNSPSPPSQSSINCTPVRVQRYKRNSTGSSLNGDYNNSSDKYKRRKLSIGPCNPDPLDPAISSQDLQESQTPKRIRYVKRESGSKNGIVSNNVELSTPDVSKREVTGSQNHTYSDQNVDSTLTSYVDSLFGVEPYKYVHDHQPLKLFWLHNSELSGLMKVPSLSCLTNEYSNSEKLYMVFTDYSIDIIQDVTYLKTIEPREEHTPFLVIYSYNLKSMYFKVVRRKIDDISMVSFNKCSKDIEDCLSFDSTSARSSSSEGEDSNYVFYRSYLYGKDYDSDPNRVRVFVHPSSKTSFDRRNLSLNSNRDSLSGTNYITLNSIKSEDFPNEKENGEAQDSYSSDSDSPFGNTLKNNQEMDLPDELFDECRLLVGVDNSGKNSGHPDSIANYRSESVIKKNFAVYLDEASGEPLSKEVLENLVKVNDEEGVLYRSGSMEFLEGQNLKIEFPTIYSRHFEYDYVTLHSDATLRSCFNFIKIVQTGDSLSININKLAQFCPNIFWNLALVGDIESAIIELDPDVLRSLYRRKRTVNSENPRSRSKNSTDALGYLDNNFTIMQNLFKRDAEEKIKKLLENDQQSSGGRTPRVVINKHAEDEDLVKALIDENGFVRKKTSVLTEKQKNIVYNECMRRNFYVPVLIKFDPNKGRGVFAAYKINKEDFLMEYKGELITEKVAKFRNNKYNKSKKYKGSFIFFFKHNGVRYGIDATEEDISFGPARLVNHSRKKANIVAKTMLSNNYPRLIFIAKRDIDSGEELLVDYGERDPNVIRENPWLLD
ncbi:[Histone H3]-lysine(4) N-trimethyltransferase [Theileria orientalis]|uniref:[Histone H3]-lysine(4) N-trimethyltransferase n=1 Tax=Theileria orientalis TaxID=68886 RepID=A0A976QTV0_THEOR|nr:[Histone H3]-lysine(4) N-trimethyltransferase [Theileria orientalis]